MVMDSRAWAQETFGESKLGDPRRVRRLVGIASGLAEHAGKSLVGAMCGDSAALEGLYRFMENPRIVTDRAK